MAAALVRPGAAGAELLIAQRPPGKWQAGRWEFPGGKIEPRESAREAVERELLEELGVKVRSAESLGHFTHDYGDRCVEIGLWLVRAFDGEPQPLDGQALRWIAPAALAGCDLLEADQPMIAPLCRALAAGVHYADEQ